MVELLKRYGANPLSGVKHGESIETEFRQAVKSGEVKKVRNMLALFEAEGSPNTLQQLATRDELGQTPLHLAALHGHDEIIRMILNHGAPVDPLNQEGYTPLHKLIWQAHDGGLDEIIHDMVIAGANIKSADESGRTALMRVIEANRTKLVELLLSKGADVSAIDTDQRGALVYAAGGTPKNFLILRLLFEHKRQSDGSLCPAIADQIYKADNTGKTPFLAACYADEKMMLILERGMNTGNSTPASRTAHGYRLLRAAILSSSKQCVKFLLDRGKDFIDLDKVYQDPALAASFAIMSRK
ncbi:ankyrin repeat-containing domain protein [Microdochium bolleyi]|uniref:Ankyrin repeat-containing domain protein n=1 Tax=Microdochium bolleyi TaxID=196109 RepID=A0A136IJN4_9PEZI|nr:ankyrin repeat-containing domain protein [Microdochium bolleyi]